MPEVCNYIFQVFGTDCKSLKDYLSIHPLNGDTYTKIFIVQMLNEGLLVKTCLRHQLGLKGDALLLQNQKSPLRIGLKPLVLFDNLSRVVILDVASLSNCYGTESSSSMLNSCFLSVRELPGKYKYQASSHNERVKDLLFCLVVPSELSII